MQTSRPCTKRNYRETNSRRAGIEPGTSGLRIRRSNHEATPES